MTPGWVLVVDDEPAVLAVTRFALRRAGYTVLTAANGAEALATYRRCCSEIFAVVLDLTMPRMSGEAVFRGLQNINPAVRVILTSGFTEREVDDRFDRANLVTFLQKPYRPQDLFLALKSAASQPRD